MIKVKLQDEVEDIQAKNGQWHEVVNDKDNSTNFSCCDCGLSHRIRVKVKDGKVFISFNEHTPMTERNRAIKKYNYIKKK